MTICYSYFLSERMANITSYIDFMYVDILEWTFKMLIYNLKNLNMKDQVDYLSIFKHLAFRF